MSRLEKIFQKLSSSSTNVDFSDLKWLVEHTGFEFKRTSGSHFIYKHPNISGIEGIVNVQVVKGQAKPYQVEQIIQLIEKYNLIEEKG